MDTNPLRLSSPYSGNSEPATSPGVTLETVFSPGTSPAAGRVPPEVPHPAVVAESNGVDQTGGSARQPSAACVPALSTPKETADLERAAEAAAASTARQLSATGMSKRDAADDSSTHEHHVIHDPATPLPVPTQPTPARGRAVTLHRITVKDTVPLAARLVAAAPKLTQAIEDWFSIPETDTRTPQQLEREKYVLWAPWSGHFSRWMIVLPSFVVQLCIGSLYSWSIFNASMDVVWGHVGANSHAFTIAIAAEGLGTLLLGNFIERTGPFNCVLYSLVLTPAAWAFACLGSWLGHIGIVYALFGVCLGLAGAFGFVGCVANIQRWFPDYKGLAAGFTVAAFGIGAFMWQLVGNHLMQADGPYHFSAYQVMGIFAVIYAGGIALSLPFIRAPPPNFQPPPRPDYKDMSCVMKGLTCIFPVSRPSAPDQPYTYLQAVIQLEFVLICVWAFGCLMPGVVFLSSAADMTKYVFHKDAAYANTIAAMLNLMNFTGRVIWGVVAERMGRRPFFILASVAQCIALGLMPLWIHLDIFGLWLLSFFVVGSLYGGCHGVLPAFLNQMFGSKIAGALHGTLLFVWAMADVVGVPIFSSIVQSNTEMVGGKHVATPQAYMLNAYWLCALPLLAGVAMLFVDTKARDRTLRKAFRECRLRICHRVCVVKCLDKREQEKEYAAYEDAMAVLKARKEHRPMPRPYAPSVSVIAIPGAIGLLSRSKSLERCERAPSIAEEDEVDVAPYTPSEPAGQV